MITLYRRQTKKFKNIFSLNNNIIIAFFVLLFFINAVSPSIITEPLQSLALKLSFVKNSVESGLIGFLSFFQSKDRLFEENENLKNQYASLSTFCAYSIQGLKSTKEELEKTLGRKRSDIKNYVGTGFVIAKPPISPYGTIEIDLGAEAGLKEGDEAVVGEYVIGYILEASKGHSMIKLYGEKGDNRTIAIGEKRLILDGQGEGFGSYKTRIANETIISLGETVWLSKNSDFIFGVVAATSYSPNDKYQELTIKSPINIVELGSVDIIAK